MPRKYCTIMCSVEAHSKIDGDCDSFVVLAASCAKKLKRIPKLMGTATTAVCIPGNPWLVEAHSIIDGDCDKSNFKP